MSTLKNLSEMSKYKRYAIVIILVSNGILISFLESFIPIPVPVPGVKLGLGNIITMIAIVFLGMRDVIFIVAIRCFVVAVLTRGVMMLAFSLTGGILSALVMGFLYKKFGKEFSIKGISIAGAMTHSSAQILVASFILGQYVIMYYLPILLVSAVITGFITGSIADIAIRDIRAKDLFNVKQERDESLDSADLLNQSPEEVTYKWNQLLPRMDSGIKLFLAVILSVIPFIYSDKTSLIIISAFMVFIILISGVRKKTILASFMAYFIIVVFPLLFGFALSILFYKISGNMAFAYYDQIGATLLRMYQLFLIWLVGAIYFNTTQIQSFIGVFDKLLTPFKWLGVPVQDHLKVLMCVIRVLTNIGPEVKASFSASMQAHKDQEKSFWGRFNVKLLSTIIVDFIVNSFKRIESVEAYVAEVQAQDLYSYKMRFGLLDVLALLITGLVIVFIQLNI